MLIQSRGFVGQFVLQKDEFTEKVVLQPFKSSILNQDDFLELMIILNTDSHKDRIIDFRVPDTRCLLWTLPVKIPWLKT